MKRRRQLPRLTGGLKGTARQIITSGRWTVRVAWSTSRNLLVAVVVLAVVLSVFPALLLFVIRAIINLLTQAPADVTQATQSLVFWLGLMLALTLTQVALTNLNEYLTTLLKLRLDFRIGVDSLKHSTTLDLALFQDSEFQDAMARAMDNMAMRASTFLTAIITILSSLFQTVTVIIFLLAIDPLAVAIIAPLTLPYFWFQSRIAFLRYDKKYRQANRTRWARYFSNKLTSPEALPEIKIYNLAPLLIRRYEDLARGFISEDLAVYRYQVSRNVLYELGFNLVLVLIFAYQAVRVIAGQFLLADLIVYNRMANMLLTLMQKISDSTSQIVESTLYISNLIKFLDTRPSMVADAGDKPGAFAGAIEFRDVSFAYPGTASPVLRNVNLRVEAGETIAVVGENGAGKTTLVMLLARLYDPTEGTILVDGQDIRTLDLRTYHRQLAYVTQRSSQYEATVKENIAYGNWENLLDNDDEVERIARLTRFHEVVARMPNGFDTVLGRRFGEYDLSGGQWQRLSISRAIAREAKILILDEPTASLDAKAEYELFTQFAALTRGSTSILISHRFTTVALADRIVVLDKGQIVETGTHDELLAADGLYARLYHLHQMQFYKDSHVGA